MRQINSLYAQYFNKKYDRIGHLWQDRYKSWCVLDETYLFTLFRYFEANPIEAALSQKPEVYRWTLLHDIKRGEILPCMRESFVLSQYDTATLLESLDMRLDEMEIEQLDRIKKESNRLKRVKKDITASFDLDSLFDGVDSKEERNAKIVEAYRIGVTQSEIAKRLNLSISSISKIIKNSKFKP